MKYVIVTLWIIVIFRAFNTGWNGNFLFVCAIAQFHLYLLDPPSSLLCTIFHLYLKILQPPLLSRHNCWENDSPWFWYINLSICQAICLPIQLVPWSFANVVPTVQWDFLYSQSFPVFLWVESGRPQISAIASRRLYFGGVCLCGAGRRKVDSEEKIFWNARRELCTCFGKAVAWEDVQLVSEPLSIERQGHTALFKLVVKTSKIVF